MSLKIELCPTKPRIVDLAVICDIMLSAAAFWGLRDQGLLIVLVLCLIWVKLLVILAVLGV